MPREPLDPLMTTTEAAKFLDIAPGTLRVWRHQGRPDQPAYVKVGRAVKYEPRELARYVSSHTASPGIDAGSKSRDPRRQQRRRGPQ